MENQNTDNEENKNEIVVECFACGWPLNRSECIYRGHVYLCVACNDEWDHIFDED